MKKVAITTLGCKTNQFESAAMTESLADEGYEIVSFDAAADIYLINTCTVTARTDAESRRLIRRAQKMNPHARIVVTGCFAQVSPERLAEMPGVTLVIGNAEKKGIAGILRNLDTLPHVMVSEISANRTADLLPLESFAEHTRAFLQIQNGCDSFCAYCIVPHARGRSRSVPSVQVRDGIRTFAAKGYREVVLTGIHLGGYGRDLTPPLTLTSLLQVIEEDRACGRVRIGSVEPTEIPEQLIALLAQSEIICPHLHIPLQSGSDTVLSRMNRHYTGSFFRQLMDRLLQAIPGLCIGVDVIAGFPGETDKEFKETYGLLQEYPLAYFHVFPFSSRPGTAAASMPGHLAPAVIAERAQLLRGLSEEKKRLYRQSYVGKKLQVLVQTEGKEGMLEGISRNYLPVVFRGNRSLMNSEVEVLVTQAGEKMAGELAV